MEADYTVKHRAGCVLIFGSMPMRDFGMLAKLMSPKALMDPRLAQMAEANFAFGLRDDLNALAVELEPAAIARAHANPRFAALSDQARVWLAVGERGMSSEAIFWNLAGVSPRPDADARDRQRHPLDADDLRRCRLLLEALPALAEDFWHMADVSPTWARLVANWPIFCDRMDREAPDWRTKPSRTPDTNELMRLAIE